MKNILSKARLVVAAGLLFAGGAAVYSAIAFNPAAQPYAYAPPLAISGFDLSKGDQKVFQTWFDPNVWRGDLVAYPVDASGYTDESTRLWYASERLKAQDWNTGRRIVTRNGTANVPFRWGELSAAQQASLGDPATGFKLVDFIRGDRSNEKQFKEVAGDGAVTIVSGSPTGTFRARASVLGDIIHGKPIYVGAPPADYLLNGYPAFKSANAARAGMVYVGANDGMVHGFDATTGDEVFAYVPSMLIAALPKLAADPYTHTYFVDGGLTAGDVYAGASSGWRTVLTGGLGAGGKGLYALDVTTPTAPDEEGAKNKILWEITNATAGFEDLGYTYGDPVIVRLAGGRWAALVGNGYNNSGSGRAVLYVIDIMTGELIKALKTSSGSLASPNGLSSPTPVDTDSNGAIDFVYAGDIDGNLWKFDLRDASVSAWTSALLFKGSRPIIGAPDISGHALGGFIVHFATGNLFTKANGEDKLVQNYAYGIWDGAPAANIALLDQSVSEATYDKQRVRVSTGHAINWSDSSDPDKPLHKGWRTALPLGEHVIGTGFVRDGRYHFTSVNASIVNEALPNGENWLMELDQLNGSTSGKLIFDLNADGSVNDVDRVRAANGGPVAGPQGIPVGVFLGAGLYAQPVMALVSAKFSTTLFNRNPFVSPNDTPDTPPPPPTGGRGVSNGHFDLDAYHGVDMGSFKHVHEYDDKYDVVGANFLNASDPVFNLVNPGINGNRVTAASEFFVLVSNGDLSPGVTLTVAGTDYKAYEFPNRFDGTQPTYTPASVAGFQFTMPQDAFEAKDWGTGVVRAGLMPTATGCVKAATPKPGAEGEVHNGALTVWIVKKGAPASAIALNVPGKPEKGYKVTNDAWVLKKYTIFWHNGTCYGNPNWVPNPASNYDPDNGEGSTPAPGSNDPKPGSAGSSGSTPPVAVSTSTTFIPGIGNDGKKNQSGVRITTTINSDGSKIIVTETINDKGKVTGSVTVRVPPIGGPPPGTPGTGTGAVPAATPSNTGTGYNQSRQGGKIGRVAWHELVKE